MNNLDITIIAIIGLSILVGFVRGGLSSILGTIGWIVALIGNHYIFNNIEPFLEAKFDSKILTFIVGYIGGLFIILFLFSIVNFLILSLFSQFRGGMIDKTIGIIFGGIRGLIIVTIVFFCFETVMKSLSGEDNSIKDYPQIVLDAETLPIIKKAEMKFIEYLPETFKESFLLTKKQKVKITDIEILNMINKLSYDLPQDTLNKINASIDNNPNYKSQRDILIAKVKALIELRNQNKMNDLSKSDLQTIQSIIS